MLDQVKPKAFKRATPLQVAQIYNTLDAILQRLENGYVAYPEGESDHTIAAKIGVSPAAVRNMRADNFGKVRDWNLRPEPGSVEERLTKIEARLAALENAFPLAKLL